MEETYKQYCPCCKKFQEVTDTPFYINDQFSYVIRQCKKCGKRLLDKVFKEDL